MFKDYFNSVAPTVLAKELFETKNKNKNGEFVELIKVRWSNSKDEIEKMSEDEKKLEQPDKILKVIKKVLNFNKKNSKKFKKKIGGGLKILTPD